MTSVDDVNPEADEQALNREASWIGIMLDA